MKEILYILVCIVMLISSGFVVGAAINFICIGFALAQWMMIKLKLIKDEWEWMQPEKNRDKKVLGIK